MPQTKRKTKPSVKKPTLSQQIAELSERSRKIKAGRVAITQNMQTYRDRLDKAELELVDAVTTQMADPSPVSDVLVSDARIARDVLMRQHKQQEYDLEMLPKAIDKLDKKLKALRAERASLENGLIAHKLTNLDELKDKAREALADLTAAQCLLGNRNTTFTSVDGAVALLNRDKSVTVLFNQKYNALEKSMGFEEI